MTGPSAESGLQVGASLTTDVPTEQACPIWATGLQVDDVALAFGLTHEKPDKHGTKSQLDCKKPQGSLP